MKFVLENLPKSESLNIFFGLQRAAIYSVDLKDPVAHASLTYSIPPKKSF